MLPEFIVAEISKNWVNGQPLTPGLLCESFEQAIMVNLQRGYLLHSWQLKRVMITPIELNETIIAVFRRLKAVG